MEKNKNQSFHKKPAIEKLIAGFLFSDGKESKEIKTFERTRWVIQKGAEIVRPYWNTENKVVGYIIKLANRQEIARPIQHIKFKKGGERNE